LGLASLGPPWQVATLHLTLSGPARKFAGGGFMLPDVGLGFVVDVDAV
jgi:hypothetical protein